MYIYWFSSESGYRRWWQRRRQRRTPQAITNKHMQLVADSKTE